jgi:polysaccharide biosynthesis transport protein
MKQGDCTMDFEKLQLKEHIRIVQKHRRMILLCMIAVLLPLAVMLWTSKPQYQASIALEVSDNTIAHLLTKDINISPDLTVANYMDLLASQSFASRVVKAMASDTSALDSTAGGQSDEPSFFDSLLGETAQPKDKQEEATIDLLKHLQTDHRGGNMIKVSFASDNPDKAYRVVKIVGDEFRKLNLEMIQRRAGVLRSFYQDQLDRAYQRVVEAEDKLAEFRRQHEITSANRETERIGTRLDNLENQIMEISGQQKLAESRFASLDNQLNKIAAKAPSKINMAMLLPRIDELKRRLVAQESELNTQSAVYTDKHPRIQSLNHDIENTVQELRRLGANTVSADTSQAGDPAMVWYDLYIERLLTEIEVNNLRTKKEGLEMLAADFRSRLLTASPDQEQEVVKLQREVEAANEAYQAMLGTHEKIRSLDAEKAINVNILEPAQRPLEPESRNRKFKLIMGLFVGLILGIGLAYLKEALDRSVKTNEDIEKKLGLTVLGNAVDFNEAAGGRRRGLFGAGGRARGPNLKDKVVPLDAPNSEAAENFRTLRANTDLALAEFEDRRIVMVTSPGSGEGKSTVAMNLAASFTLYGKKTLLLDTDLYNPTMHLRLGIQPNIGLSNWLTEEIVSDTMRNKIILNGSAMDFIPTGNVKVTFQKLAINSKMQSLLAALREQYDVIIIDAPPVIPVADPMLLVPYVDLVLMVVESGRTEMDAARQAVKILKKAKATAIGVVRNRTHVNEEYNVNNYFRPHRRLLPATTSKHVGSKV